MRHAPPFVCALLWLVGGGAFAQTPPANGQPDVLILIYAQPDGSAQMAFSYAEAVPHAQVLRDVQALGTASGWTLSAIEITDAVPSVRGAKEKLTSVECAASPVLLPASHTLPVEPFIEAFRTRHRLALTYLVPPSFAFAGLRTYADNGVQVALEQHDNAYTYQITIRDSHFGRLNLPASQPPMKTRGVQSGRRGLSGAGRAALIGITALVAVGAGYVVYVVMARHA